MPGLRISYPWSEIHLLNINIAAAKILRRKVFCHRNSCIWNSFIVLTLVCVYVSIDTNETKWIHIENEIVSAMELWFDFTRFHRISYMNIYIFSTFNLCTSKNTYGCMEVKCQVTEKKVNKVLTKQRHDPFTCMYINARAIQQTHISSFFVCASYYFYVFFFHFEPFFSHECEFFFSSCSFDVFSRLYPTTKCSTSENDSSECCIDVQKAKPQSYVDHIFMCC